MSITDQNNFKDLKLIHAGLHRTGTASICLALDKLGFGPVWHAINPLLPAGFQDEHFKWFLQHDITVLLALVDMKKQTELKAKHTFEQNSIWEKRKRCKN